MFKTICIAGDGPVGLYLAIRLTQLGVKNVKLIGKREGVYTRPGQVTIQTFENISDKINHRLFVHRSSDNHIANNHLKELERELYQYAVSLNIQFIHQSFYQVSDAKNIIIVDKENKQTLDTCDLLFDASGSKRVVVTDINKKENGHQFTVSEVSYNPLRKHYQTQVQMDAESVERITLKRGIMSLFQPELTISEKLKQKLAYYKVYKKYGWPTFATPEVHRFIFQKNKVILCAEKPANMPEEFNDEWVRELLACETLQPDLRFKDLPPARKYKKKPRKQEFDVNPKKIEPFFREATPCCPAIIPIGDALFEPDFRLGQGVNEGIKRVDAFLECIQVNGGEITSIEWNAYTQNLKELISAQTKSIQEEYSEKIRKIDCAEFYEEEKIKRLIEDSSIVAEDQILEEGKQLSDLFNELIKMPTNFRHRLAEFKFKLSQKIKLSQKFDQKGKLIGENDYYIKQSLLEEALTFHNPGRLKNEIERALLELAEDYLQAALCSLKTKCNSRVTARFFKQSFKIYELVFSRINQCIFYTSSFFKVSSKNSTPIFLLISLHKAIELFGDSSKFQNKIDKLNYFKLMTMMKIILKESFSIRNKKNTATYNEIKTLYADLTTRNYLSIDKRNQLTHIIGDIERNFQKSELSYSMWLH
ncbi:hypothetical protein Lqui_1756 [Legionella quinlivanii]|uniref:Uncharacterized protein n=1 Tax=Legionella quinlivanii TaxID=45073 RepID=A0A0W0Y158_9GAMM|nr:hypothetical protein [Legionella quinlivanii]KTD50431.1 hypothetical protein Lqui_1756 [Legionella quinlivanii]SEF40423.1 hypothetical protein SAMN02746093_00067 [Legionella quinlivanii DSM 21216]STY12031.1 Uncharacterised protein [Legionella quinlivanii]